MRGALSALADIALLYERYGHAIYRRCLRLLGDAAEAEEMMQETFAQFCAQHERFEARSSLFTYLYRIATNLSIDRLRRRTRQGPHQAIDVALASGERNPEQQTAALEALAALTKGLDEETLTVAVMRYADQMTQEEIASALDLSRRTVATKLEQFLTHTRKRALRQA
jgi:RNA polymerase sigma-70 factor (ECF subfamily)